jgi:hypothetical protein
MFIYQQTKFLKIMRKRILTMLALFAMTTGAWADWGGGTYTATTGEDLFDDITVNDDNTRQLTLTLPE